MQCCSCVCIFNGLDFRIILFSPIHVCACIHDRCTKYGDASKICECFCRLETVNIRRQCGQAKVLGTIVTVGGAMLMTLVKGPMLNLPWINENGHQESTSATNKQDVIKGALMMLAGFFCWSGFVILQVRV